jgi:hypothetical protein
VQKKKQPLKAATDRPDRYVAPDKKLWNQRWQRGLCAACGLKGHLSYDCKNPDENQRQRLESWLNKALAKKKEEPHDGDKGGDNKKVWPSTVLNIPS